YDTLVYFNACLDRYREMDSVFSITGWCPASSLFRIPDDYPYDVFFMPRNGSWGWAIWKDRWDKIDWDLRDYEYFAREKSLVNAFSDCGDDLPNMLKAQVDGVINTWDIQICYAQFKHRAVTVYPVKSYTANIGLDGSGTHFSGNCVKFSSKLEKHSDLLRLPNHIFVDTQIQYAFRKVYDKPKIGIRLLNRFSRILFNKNLFNQ
ncbi:MAG: hypothetical protein Q8T08_13880, partial [Ignavibacteria bacterium]|nr:hypothetical protein [Ignavibacteria bacterium]